MRIESRTMDRNIKQIEHVYLQDVIQEKQLLSLLIQTVVYELEFQ